MVAEDVGTYIGLRSYLEIGMAKLEDDLRLADREAILVGDATPQNEGVIVEAEVIGVDEDDFAQLHRLRLKASDIVLHAVLFGRQLEHPAKIEESFARVKLVGPQDELAANVLGRVNRHAVSIATRFELGDAAHPTLGNRLVGLIQDRGIA